MALRITFGPGEWENTGLVYAYSWRFRELPRFRQEKDCIANSAKQGDPGDYDYMGLMLPETYTAGAKIGIRCAFEEAAAPMLILSGENETDENGILRTLEYYEIVIWKNGLNVWRHHTERRNTTHYKVLGAVFPLRQEEEHILNMEVREKRLVMDVDGHRLDLFVHDLPDRFTLGYTACEGICRLYEMTVQNA